MSDEKEPSIELDLSKIETSGKLTDAYGGRRVMPRITKEDLVPRKGIYRHHQKVPAENIEVSSEYKFGSGVDVNLPANPNYDGDCLLSYRRHLSKPKRVRGLGQRKARFTRYHI